MVVAAAGVFGAVVWILGSGAQTARVPDETLPDPEVTMASTSPDTTYPTVSGTFAEGEDPSSWEPNPIPEGPLRSRARVNRVRQVAAAPDGSLWAATDGGIVKWNPATGSAVVFESGMELPATGVTGVVIGPDGTVWAGSRDWIGRWNGSWTRFATPDGFERPLAVGPDGVVWWGSSDDGSVGWFDGADWGVFEDVVLVGSESMAVAPDGTVWASMTSTDAAESGVAEYDGSEWVRHGADEGWPGGVGGSVSVTPEGIPWVGSMGTDDLQSAGGVARYDGSTWVVFTVDDGLVANYASVASGPEGTVWAVAPGGLARFGDSGWVGVPDTAGFGFGATIDGSGALWAPATSPMGGLKGFDGITTRRLLVEPEGVIDADAEGERTPSGAQTPDDARLDFLATLCNGRGEDVCYRDGHFLDPQDAAHGTGVWLAGLPFHIREGFVNQGLDPLGASFEIVVSVTRLAGPELADGAFALDQRYRFRSDYVVRGEALKCGPGYWSQIDPQPCEWFVHDFSEGLPPGRYDIWVEWQAPCSAWLGLGLADACDDPTEVAALFASSVNMPFYGPGYWEGMAEPLDPYVYPDSITKGAIAR